MAQRRKTRRSASGRQIGLFDLLENKQVGSSASSPVVISDVDPYEFVNTQSLLPDTQPTSKLGTDHVSSPQTRSAHKRGQSSTPGLSRASRTGDSLTPARAKASGAKKSPRHFTEEEWLQQQEDEQYKRAIEASLHEKERLDRQRKRDEQREKEEQSRIIRELQQRRERVDKAIESVGKARGLSEQDILNEKNPQETEVPEEETVSKSQCLSDLTQPLSTTIRPSVKSSGSRQVKVSIKKLSISSSMSKRSSKSIDQGKLKTTTAYESTPHEGKRDLHVEQEISHSTNLNVDAVSTHSDDSDATPPLSNESSVDANIDTVSSILSSTKPLQHDEDEEMDVSDPEMLMPFVSTKQTPSLTDIFNPPTEDASEHTALKLDLATVGGLTASSNLDNNTSSDYQSLPFKGADISSSSVAQPSVPQGEPDSLPAGTLQGEPDSLPAGTLQGEPDSLPAGSLSVLQGEPDSLPVGSPSALQGELDSVPSMSVVQPPEESTAYSLRDIDKGVETSLSKARSSSLSLSRKKRKRPSTELGSSVIIEEMAPRSPSKSPQAKKAKSAEDVNPISFHKDTEVVSSQSAVRDVARTSVSEDGNRRSVFTAKQTEFPGNKRLSLAKQSSNSKSMKTLLNDNPIQNNLYNDTRDKLADTKTDSSSLPVQHTLSSLLPPMYCPPGSTPSEHTPLIIQRFNSYFSQLRLAQSKVLTRLKWGEPVKMSSSRQLSLSLDVGRKTRRSRNAEKVANYYLVLPKKKLSTALEQDTGSEKTLADSWIRRNGTFSLSEESEGSDEQRDSVMDLLIQQQPSSTGQRSPNSPEIARDPLNDASSPDKCYDDSAAEFSSVKDNMDTDALESPNRSRSHAFGTNLDADNQSSTELTEPADIILLDTQLDVRQSHSPSPQRSPMMSGYISEKDKTRSPVRESPLSNAESESSTRNWLNSRVPKDSSKSSKKAKSTSKTRPTNSKKPKQQRTKKPKSAAARLILGFEQNFNTLEQNSDSEFSDSGVKADGDTRVNRKTSLSPPHDDSDVSDHDELADRRQVGSKGKRRRVSSSSSEVEFSSEAKRRTTESGRRGVIDLTEDTQASPHTSPPPPTSTRLTHHNTSSLTPSTRLTRHSTSPSTPSTRLKYHGTSPSTPSTRLTRHSTSPSTPSTRLTRYKSQLSTCPLCCQNFPVSVIQVHADQCNGPEDIHSQNFRFSRTKQSALRQNQHSAKMYQPTLEQLGRKDKEMAQATGDQIDSDSVASDCEEPRLQNRNVDKGNPLLDELDSALDSDARSNKDYESSSVLDQQSPPPVMETRLIPSEDGGFIVDESTISNSPIRTFTKISDLGQKDRERLRNQFRGRGRGRALGRSGGGSANSTWNRDDFNELASSNATSRGRGKGRGQSGKRGKSKWFYRSRARGNRYAKRRPRN